MRIRAAITGAGGLVGRAVVRRLLESGIEACAVVRPGGSGSIPEACHIVPADLGDPAALAKAMHGCHAVVHAAAQMRGDEDEITAVNLDGTRNVLRAIEEARVQRLVFLSTVAVYGEGDMIEVTEDRELRPMDAYARSKAKAEEAVREACVRTGLEAWILRPTTVYDPEDREGFTAYMLNLARDGVIPLVRKGAVRFDLVAASDVAQACLLAATGPPGAGEPLHVTSGEDLTVAGIVERIRNRLGLPVRTVEVEDPNQPPEGVPASLVRALAEHRSFSIRRAQTLLGYKPSKRFPDDLIGIGHA